MDIQLSEILAMVLQYEQYE